MLKVKSQKYILGLYAASLLVMPTKNVSTHILVTF